MSTTPLVLDHIGLAVASIDESLPLFEAITRARAGAPETVQSQGVRVVFIGSGAGRLELLEPLSSGSTIARFLERRGPGLHHIAWRVSDIEAALARFDAEGYELIDRIPRPGAGGHLVAFLHPSSTGGVLMELVQG